MEEAVAQLFAAVSSHRNDIVRAIAMKAMHLGIADDLFKAKQEVDGVDMTALHAAVTSNQPDIVRTLLASGASLTEKDGLGRTVLELGRDNPTMQAAFTGEFLQSLARNDLERVQSLISSGLPINGGDGASSGNTPLHWAAAYANTQALALLLSAGAHVNATNNDGATPLHDAARRGDADVVHTLLEHGANPLAKGTGGVYTDKLPLDMVPSPDSPVREELLKASMAQGLSVKEASRRQSEGNGEAASATASAEASQHHLRGGLAQRIDDFVEKAAESLAQEHMRDITQRADKAMSPAAADGELPMSEDGFDTDRSMDETGPPPAAAATSIEDLDESLKLLWPQPKHIVQTAGERFLLKDGQAEVYFAPTPSGTQSPNWPDHTELLWKYIHGGLLSVGIEASRCKYPGDRCDVTLRLIPTLSVRAESYRIIVEATGVILVGGDVSGLRHAITTFLHLIKLCRAVSSTGSSPGTTDGIPPLRILDFPSLPHRGFMLDVSRDKVPTMRTLYGLVDLMVSLKMNQLQLYMEHTFAYLDHKIVWQDADPYTANDILALDQYCKDRGVSLIPNQNSFGHFHRFLRHDRYRSLAECPEGIDFGPRPSGPQKAPFSLCPIDERAILLVNSLYDELFPNFTSSTFAHVGLDETVDLGEGRSREICERMGHAEVYLNYLRQVRESCRRHGRVMMFWADMVQDFPQELLYRLPSDVVAMEWGYEESHPFEKNCRRLADAGVPFFVCPGTSSWNTLTGRTANCLENVRSSIRAATKLNALGVLLTDWGDHGHTQPLSLSFPAIVATAGLSWNEKAAAIRPPTRDVPTAPVKDWEGQWGEDDLATLLDVYVYNDVEANVGEILCDLGNTYLHACSNPRANRNGAALFHFVVYSSEDTRAWRYMESAEVKRALRHLRDQISKIDNAGRTAQEKRHQLAQTMQQGVPVNTHVLSQLAALDEQILSLEELRLAADLSVFACMLCLAQLKQRCAIRDLPPTQRTDLANRLLPLLEKYQRQWPRRNRPAGLDDSIGRIRHTLDALVQPNEDQ